MSRPAVLDTREEWSRDALKVIRAFAASGLEFTAEDLKRCIRPAPASNDIGRLFTNARRAGLITAIGYRPSNDRSRKGGVIRIWTRRMEHTP